jgi:subtilisin family serine protease
MVVGLALLLASIPATVLAAPPLERIIVVLKPGGDSPAAVARDVAAQQAGTVGFVYETAIRGFSIAVAAPAVAAIARNPRVAYVEPDVEINITGTQPIPTGIDRIDADRNPAPAALEGVDVAIIDTGVWIGHPDLNLRYVTDCTGAILYPWFGGCSASGNHQDENGHGTHVAGIAAAFDNDIGTVGTAPGATLWSLKAFNADGSGTLGAVLAAIDLVAANSAAIEVVNMSFTVQGSYSSLNQSISATVARGVVMVAAAGNSAADASGFSPANHPDVITVSALADFDGLPGGLAGPTCWNDVDDTLADFSNFGPSVNLAAPGVCIYSAWLGGDYALATGTSMAAPFVTGAVARLIAQGYPKPTNRAGVLALRDALVSGALPQSSPCGFSGDPDASREPLLFMNSALFGGDGTCGNATEPPPNQPPTAAFSNSCTALVCTFTDGSNDPDGTIVGWSWTFGDGSTSSDQNPSHTYAAPGTFSVGLTVTDNRGATSSTSAAVTVTAPAEQVMTATVGPISRSGRTASVTVTVADSNGAGVGGALVNGSWTYLDNRGRTRTVSESGTTNANGQVAFSETFPPNARLQRFCVTNVTKSDWTYSAGPAACRSA